MSKMKRKKKRKGGAAHPPSSSKSQIRHCSRLFLFEIIILINVGCNSAINELIFQGTQSIISNSKTMHFKILFIIYTTASQG
jgi:hypothetical protein